MSCWRTTQCRIRAEAVLGLCHANRQIAISLIFPLFELITDLLIGEHFISAVNPLSNSLNLLQQAASRRDTEPWRKSRPSSASAIAAIRVARSVTLLSSHAAQCLDTGSLHCTRLGHIVPARGNLGICCPRDEMVDRNHRRHTKRTSIFSICDGQGSAQPACTASNILRSHRDPASWRHHHSSSSPGSSPPTTIARSAQ